MTHAVRQAVTNPIVRKAVKQYHYWRLITTLLLTSIVVTMLVFVVGLVLLLTSR